MIFNVCMFLHFARNDRKEYPKWRTGRPKWCPKLETNLSENVLNIYCAILRQKNKCARNCDHLARKCFGFPGSRSYRCHSRTFVDRKNPLRQTSRASCTSLVELASPESCTISSINCGLIINLNPSTVLSRIQPRSFTGGLPASQKRTSLKNMVCPMSSVNSFTLAGGPTST